MNEKDPFIIALDKGIFLFGGVFLGIGCFVSERALSLHREHLASLSARKRMGMQAADLDALIRSHEVYFSSFRKERVRCARVTAAYGSENAFAFALKEYAAAKGACFLYIYPLRRFPFVGFSSNERDAFRALLCIDLFEHAYFHDYGFDRESYLLAAISHLDLSVLDKDFCEKRRKREE